MPLDLNSSLYDRLSNDALNKLQKSMYRAVDLIENFFPIPDEPGTLIKLYPDQRDLIDTIQFGFPISKFRFSEMEGKVVGEGGICMSRRQVGKSVSFGYTAGALNIIGGGFPDYKVPCRCGMVAASEDAAIELIDKTKFALEESDFNDFITGRTKVDRIKLVNGSFTRAHPCSVKSVRGHKYHYLFGDEGRWMDETVLFHAALPTVEHGFRWFIITTPQGTKGELTRMYMDAVRKRPIICKNCLAEYMRQDFPLAKFPEKNNIWVMPSLPPCKKCLSTEYKFGVGYIATPWINPWECSIIDQVKLKARLDYFSWSPWARQEWLGELLDEASSVILNDWIINSTNMKLRNTMTKRIGIRYVLGLDYGRLHDASVFTIVHKDPETKQIILDYMRAVSGKHDFDKDWDYIRAVGKEIIEFFQPSIIMADSTGIGYPEVEKMKKEIHNWSPGSVIYNSQKNWYKLPPEKRRLGFIFDRINKPQLIGNLKTYFSTNPPVLQIPPKTEPEMDDFVTELLKFDCTIHENGYIEYGTQDYFDDRVISFALALWAYSSFSKTAKAKPRTVEYNYIKKKPRRNPGYNYRKAPIRKRKMIKVFTP